MTWSYQIDTSKQRVISTLTQVYTDQEMAEHANALARDPQFGDHFDQIVDLTGVTKLAVTSEGVEANADLEHWDSGSRRAFVAFSDVAFGMSRMYEILRGDRNDEIRVFRIMDAAASWLDDRWDAAAEGRSHGPATRC